MKDKFVIYSLRNPPVRWRILAVCAFVVICAIAPLGLRWIRPAPLEITQSRLAEADASQPGTAASSETKSKEELDLHPGALPPKATPLSPQATPHSRQLVNAVSRLNQANNPLTRDEAEQWKKNLDQLIQQGPDGAAAIAEFLQTNTDVMFGRAGSQFLGFNSAREALFDALRRIGGPEATSAMLQALQNSADPREIALLAQNLDKLAPDVHRHDAVSAAREVMAMAENGKLQNADVAPLFEVLQNFGGSHTDADLEQAARQWPFYSAIALAHLPEGAGIPSLIRMVQGNGPAASTALQLLGELSGSHGQAQSALLAQADANAIPPHTWPFLVNSLGGNEYHFKNSGFFGDRTHPGNVGTAHISSGNQSFYSAFTPGSLTQEQINSRIAFIDQLRAATSQPAALQALQQAEDLLVRRLPNIAIVSP